MKLYQGRIPTIARELVDALTRDGQVEVRPEMRDEVAMDLESVLREYMRTEREITERARDLVATRGLSYQHVPRVRQQIAQERGVKVGEDAIDYLCDQIIEMLFYSKHVDEVYAPNHELRRLMRPVIRRHTAVDQELDEEVRTRIKHLQEGTNDWEIEYRKTMEELRRARKLDD